MATCWLEIVSKERLIYKGEVEFIKLPAAGGEIGILPGHAPVILSLKAGNIEVRESEGAGVKTFSLTRGSFKFSKNKGICLLHS